MQKSDVIYRQQAIDKMRKLPRWNVVRGYNKNEGFLYDDVMYLLDNLSPARIERKKGEWIPIWNNDDPDTSTYAECSECGIRQRRPVGCFCKWCGTDMRGDEK